MLPLKQIQALATSVPGRTVDSQLLFAGARCCLTHGDGFLSPDDRKNPVSVHPERTTYELPILSQRSAPNEIEPLYLFACHIKWGRKADPTAGWELIAASRVRTAMLAHMREPCSPVLGIWVDGVWVRCPMAQSPEDGQLREDEMKGPYGLEVTDNCVVHESEPRLFLRVP